MSKISVQTVRLLEWLAHVVHQSPCLNEYAKMYCLHCKTGHVVAFPLAPSEQKMDEGQVKNCVALSVMFASVNSENKLNCF